MLETTAKKIKVVKPGDNVMVPVPDLHMGPEDPSNRKKNTHHFFNAKFSEIKRVLKSGARYLKS